MAESATRLSPVPAVMAALVPALFAFGGWQRALWISGEVKEPKRNLPLAIIGGVTVVVAVYLLANWAYLKLLGVEQMAASSTLAADAVAAVMPGMGRKLVAAAVAVSAFGVLNSQLLSGPRLIFGIGMAGSSARSARSIRGWGRRSRRSCCWRGWRWCCCLPRERRGWTGC